LIIGALADYSKQTGIDLSNHPFAATLEQANSPEAILQLLQQREKAFKEYRDGNRRLINCLSPAVKVLQAFSGVMGEAVSPVTYILRLIDLSTRPLQVPLPPVKALFVGIGALLDVRLFNTILNYFSCDIGVCQAASGVSSSYDALLNLFECLANFLRRLEIYTMIPPTQLMTDIILKIMLEILSVLALATKQIKEGRFSKCPVIDITSD
jgi:hypothetical protein